MNTSSAYRFQMTETQRYERNAADAYQAGVDEARLPKPSRWDLVERFGIHPFVDRYYAGRSDELGY